MGNDARVPASRVRRLRWISNLGAAAAIVIATASGGTQGCGGSKSSDQPGNGSSGGASSGSGGGSGGSGSGAGDGGVVTGQDGAVVGTCNGASDGIVVPKRLVRLTFNQILNSIGSLLDFVSIPGSDGGAATNLEAVLVNKYQITDAQHRTFPPLTNLTEGSNITTGVWTQSDLIAQDVGQFVHDNFSAVTKCATATDACAQAWLASFAQSAFRRPLTSDESTKLTAIYTGDEANGGTIQEATQYEVYAIFSWPEFLYRWEFGTDTEDPNASKMAGPLSPYEVAEEISYYLTDGPPDSALLMAAANNQLASQAQIAAQVTRILATPVAQANLEAAMFSYFSIQGLEAVVIDTGAYPNFTPQMRNSMRHEVELFLHDRLWSGVVGDLLTSTQSRLNQNLATLYGVSPFPQAGQTPDSMGFALTQLPNTRTGILTQAGFLTSKARPMAGSIIARGLIVNASFLCAENPGPPTDPATLAKVGTQSSDTTQTDRQKADYRAMNAPCNGCHPHFDPYGEALGAYDTIGQFKPNDSTGTPINTSATLPPNAGGQMITGPLDMAKDLTQGTTFAACMTRNIMAYALADAVNGATADTCAVLKPALAGDGSFSSVVGQIASSQTLTQRLGGM